MSIGDPLRPKARLRATLSLSVLVAIACSTPVAAQSTPPKGKRVPAFVFPHTLSDIAPDPRAHFGQLKNGMTYILYKNTTPPGYVSIAFRFGAGSLMEQDYQRGLAHFIEHMAFNGSKNVPQGDMVKMLERDGLSFGGDTNAFTSYDQTVYTLNIDKVSERTLDDSLFLFRELGGNMSLELGAVDRQRGVVLSEERLRDSAGARAYKAMNEAMMPDEKATMRNPIGLVDIIQHAPRSALADFYRDFYRPEYATLIIVGDIDPDQVEAKVKARFSDWEGQPQSNNAVVDLGSIRPHGVVARTYVEKGLPDNITLFWNGPIDDRIETHKTDFENFVRIMANGVLAERFSRRALTPDAAFLVAKFSRSQQTYKALTYQLGIDPKPHMARVALDQALTMFRQFRKFGVTQDELDRQILEYTTRADAAARQDSTRFTPIIAGQLTMALNGRAVFNSPTQQLALFNEAKPKLTLKQINDYIQTFDPGDGPFIWRQSDDVSDAGADALLATYKANIARPVAPPVPFVAKRWPYDGFGVPGKVVAHEALADFGATRITFANGVKLNFKHTDFSKGLIQTIVRFDGGYTMIPQSDAVTLQAARSVGLIPGGLGRLKPEDIAPALAGKQAGAGASINEDATYIAGASTPDSFTTELQVLMAFATDPGLDPRALDRWKATLPDDYKMRDSDPSGVFGVKATRFLRGGDPRYGRAPQAQMAGVKMESIRALWTRLLATTPIEITIVGDTTEEEAIKQVAATFATLPRRPSVPPVVPGAEIVRFPITDLHQVYAHDGRADQAMSAIAWPTTDDYANPQESSGLQMLSRVMTSRLLAEVRERQGATYSVSANNEGSEVFKGYGILRVIATVKPEAEEQFYDSVAKIANDLKSSPATEDEMKRARQPLLDQIDVERKANGFYTGALSGSVAIPAQLEVARTKKQRLLDVTSKDVQALAIKYLDMGKAAHVQVAAASFLAKGDAAHPHHGTQPPR